MAERHITLKAFTLSSFNVKNADRLLHLLTKEDGVITVYAGGAGRPKSRLLACSTPFTLSEFELYKAGDRYSVINADIIYAFPGIRGDFDRLEEASRLARLVEDATRFDIGSSGLYDIFGYALYAIADRPDPALSAALAALRIVAEIGFAPHLQRCVTCQASLVAPYRFSQRASGALCKRHEAGYYDLQSMALPLVQVIEHAIHVAFERVLTIQISEPLKTEVTTWIWRYIEFQMEKSYPGFYLPDVSALAPRGE